MKPNQMFNASAAVPSGAAAELQTRLRHCSYTDASIPQIGTDGIYGKETVAALHAFQRAHNLPESDKPDAEAWDVLCRVEEAELRKRSPGLAVVPVFRPAVLSTAAEDPAVISMVQLLLGTVSSLCGISYPIRITGCMNEETAAALAVVQQCTGARATGRLDLETWNALAALYNAETEKRQRGI